MRAEVINTGDELLLGRVVNSHLAFLGERLWDAARVRISRQAAVMDGDDIAEAMREAFGRCEFLIVTGGLGPTSDDLTRETTAALLGRALREDPSILDLLTERMAARGLEVDARTRRQAQVPEGAEILPNPLGTAPGLYFPATSESPHLFLLPGPPRELRPMVEAEVLPRVCAVALGNDPPLLMRHYKFFGAGESEIAAAVEDELRAADGIEIGYQVETGQANLRCTGDAGALARADAIVRTALGPYLVSDDGRSLAEVVVGLLGDRREAISTAESCTGGLIASMLTDVPGASEVFRTGYVTYSNEAKEELLGVPGDLLERHGAVSEPVARAMAAGALERSGDDHAIAVTGTAGPGGGTPEKPVGTVFIGLASRGGGAPTVLKRNYPYGRDLFKVMVSKCALDCVRRKLLPPPPEGAG
ncbi:competence/damage-inducible protein A [soil metagenome]